LFAHYRNRELSNALKQANKLIRGPRFTACKIYTYSKVQ
jgi:hypothetical protein